MAGLVPAIHVFFLAGKSKDVDARHKAGHDEEEGLGLLASLGPGMTAARPLPRRADQPLRGLARLLGDLGAGQHAGDLLAPPLGRKLAYIGRDTLATRMRILGDEVMPVR